MQDIQMPTLWGNCFLMRSQRFTEAAIAIEYVSKNNINFRKWRKCNNSSNVERQLRSILKKTISTIRRTLTIDVDNLFLKFRQLEPKWQQKSFEFIRRWRIWNQESTSKFRETNCNEHSSTEFLHRSFVKQIASGTFFNRIASSKSAPWNYTRQVQPPHPTEQKHLFQNC